MTDENTPFTYALPSFLADLKAVGFQTRYLEPTVSSTGGRTYVGVNPERMIVVSASFVSFKGELFLDSGVIYACVEVPSVSELDQFAKSLSTRNVEYNIGSDDAYCFVNTTFHNIPIEILRLIMQFKTVVWEKSDFYPSSVRLPSPGFPGDEQVGYFRWDVFFPYLLEEDVRFMYLH